MHKEPITEQMLCDLRAEMQQGLSAKRYRHVAAVEEAVGRMAAIYCPEKRMLLRAAALLHDMTKEYTDEEQIAVLGRFGVSVSPLDRLAPKTHHARSAAALIPSRYPTFADPELVSCVRWHTTGHASMTLSERLLYLADYIDESRTFRDCVILRGLFWGAHPEAMTQEEREAHLREVLILSFDLTVQGLLAQGVPISPDTTDARNALLLEQNK